MESTSTLPEFFHMLVSSSFSMLTMADRLRGATDRISTPISRARDPESTGSEASPITLNESVIIQPKSQEDWEPYEQTIKSLYLGENMPRHEVVEVMLRLHSFNATERMYKRQFLKWKWRKYNAKGYWDSTFNGDQVETPKDRAKCKRPARQKRCDEVATRNNTVDLDGRLQVSCHNLVLLGTLQYGNRTDSCASELFVNLRDLICGNHRRIPTWNEHGTSVFLSKTGQYVLHLLDLAGYLFRINNHRPGGAALRRAFILLEELIKDEAIDTYRALFFDIPYGVPEAALDMYFGHLSRLLSIKRSGEPIARIATLAERLSGENHGHLFWAIGRMHDIAADLYDGILGKDDLNSLEARFQALTLRGHCGVTPAQGHTEFLARYDAVVNETASSFGPFSSEVLAVEQRQVSVAMELSVEPHAQYDLGERHYRRLVVAHQSEPFEIWSATSLYQFCWVAWILQDIEYVTQADPGSWRLEQAIHAFPYALQKAGLEEESGDGSLLFPLFQFGNVLLGILSRLGRHKEADGLQASLNSYKLLQELSRDIADADGFP